MAIDYKFLDSLLVRQAEVEKEMLAEFKAGKYTYEKPLIKYNPYIISPLSAVILFRTEEETAITLTVIGKKKVGNIHHTFPKGKEHILPVLGLYNNYENKIEIRPYRKTPSVITIKTPDVYDGEQVCYSMETTPEYMQDDIMFITPAGDSLASGFDYDGEARWHLNVPCIFDMKRVQNGHVIIGTDRLIKMPYYVTGLYEMDLVGKVYKEYCLPGGYHHDAIEMPDGNIVSLTDDFSGDTVEDHCALIDRKTGEILKMWDYRDFLPMGEGKSGSWSDEDWFHNNAVWYDANTNSLTLSGRHMDIMCNIDFHSGKLNWIISDPAGWPKEWVDKYFFKPIGKDFEWQYEQHACLITPDGDVMCFDNHHYGSKDKDHYLTAKDSYSRGVRYRINMDDRTIEQVWQYGKERGADFFSPYICNVEYYNEGHYMVHSGGIAYINDEPSDLLGAFAKDQEGGRLETRTVEVCDGKVMMDLHVPGNFYRGEKLKMYTDGSNLEIGEGKRLGKLGVTKEFDTDIPLDNSGKMLPESCDARIEDEEDRFTFFSRFEKGQMVMLMLEKGEEKHRYFISTTAVRHLAMCCGTFLDTDERNTRTSVNKIGLSGTYDVRVIIDDMKYETGVKITC